MGLRSYTSEGIVLSKKNFGEADKILVVYSRRMGKVSLIAKGIRRPKSKKRGHLEVFNKIFFQATHGNGIDLVTEAESLKDFSKIKKSLKKVSLAYYFSEVIGKITHDHESNDKLFDLVESYFNRLTKESKLKKLRLDFISDLLVLMGYWPKGRFMENHDEKLEEVVERQLSSMRVGKIMLK